MIKMHSLHLIVVSSGATFDAQNPPSVSIIPTSFEGPRMESLLQNLLSRSLGSSTKSKAAPACLLYACLENLRREPVSGGHYVPHLV